MIGGEFPAKSDGRRRDCRGNRLLKVADETSLEAAQQTLCMAPRNGRFVRAAFPLDTRAESCRGSARTRIAVEVRGADEEGVPDEDEQH